MALTVAERGQRFRENHPEEVKQRKTQWRDYLRNNHICQWCQAAPTLPDRVRCQACVDKGKERRYANIQTWLSLGLCGECGRYPHLPAMSNNPTYRVCEICYIRKTALSCLGTKRHWKVIQQKLYAQEFKCTYTGRLLVLGENASLDHIYPLHTYPHLKSDPNNTEWVLQEINEMKRNRTPEQFLTLIQHILHYRAC
jgi:hypothetical protein